MPVSSSNGSSNGRDELGRFVDGRPNGILPGTTRNPGGSSAKRRFQAAVRRSLLKTMREGDDDELDQLGEQVVKAATRGDKHANAMLRECWSRWDGPLETRIAGPDGGPLVVFQPLGMIGIDQEKMRTGLPVDELKKLPESNGNGQ